MNAETQWQIATSKAMKDEIQERAGRGNVRAWVREALQAKLDAEKEG